MILIRRLRPISHRNVASLIASGMFVHDVCIVFEAQLFVEMDRGSATRVGEKIKIVDADLARPGYRCGEQEFTGLEAT